MYVTAEDRPQQFCSVIALAASAATRRQISDFLALLGVGFPRFSVHLNPLKCDFKAQLLSHLWIRGTHSGTVIAKGEDWRQGVNIEFPLTDNKK